MRHVIKNTFLNTNVLKFRQNCVPQTIYLIRLTSSIHFFVTKILRNLKIWDLNLVIHQFPKPSSFLRNLILPLVILGLTKLKNFFILILVKLSYLIRRDRKARAGGLLVYTKKSYQILNLVIDPVFETITFSTLLHRIKHTFVSSYNPHFKFSPVYLVHLEDLLKTFFAKKFINLTLIGDLNQDLLSINGDNLKSLMSAFNLKSHMNSPTRIACRKIAGTDHLSETCIDVVYSNSNLISSLECVPCPFSDHNFVILSLDAKCSTLVLRQWRQEL